MKHSPAPWGVSRHFEDDGKRHSNVNHIYIPNAPSGEGCTITLEPAAAMTPDKAYANAKLISLAPEMYEVLKGIEDWCNGGDNEFHTTALDLLERIRGK